MVDGIEPTENQGIQSYKDDAKAESSEFISIRDEILREFSEIEKALVKRKDLVLRLGKAIEQHGKGIKKEDICKAIKFYLRDAIERELISERDITRYCPDAWKNETKPKKKDKLSFSEQDTPKQIVAISAEGQSISQQASTTTISASWPNEELEKKLAVLANQLADKTTEISRQNDDIEALKLEKKALQEQITQASFKPASDLVENPQELKKRVQDQAKLLLPFEAKVEFEIKGQILPLIVKVQPVTKSVTVKLDEVTARRMSEA